MSKLTLGGKVFYSDARTPVANAQVQIYDLDQGGNGNDKIFEGTTNGNGEFSGTSTVWSDRNTVTIAGFTTDTPDFMALEFRVVANGQVHKGPYFHLGDRTSYSIVTPFTSPVLKAQREVVHLITLSEAMDGASKQFYEAIEAGAALTSNSLLGPQYGNTHYLQAQQATLSALCQKLEQVAAKSSVKAVDLIISPHGLDDKLCFYPNDALSMSLVADKIKAIPVAYRRKFRMVFSTACFGASHIDEWLDCGFKVASGSEQVYADSLVSFPAFLGTWVMGGSFKDAINAANMSDPLRIQDTLAKPVLEAMGSSFANQVNSTRRVGGNGNLRISSIPA